MRFEVYRSTFRREWRWRLLAANNRIVATSGEGYRNKADCLGILNRIKADVWCVPVVEKD